MKKLLWILSMLIAVVVAGLAFIYISPDYDIYVVRSESMKPTINMGDIILTGPSAGFFNREIKPGVIVTYQKGESLVTHRVMSSNNDTLITKGDAVEDPDLQPVSTSQVRGIYLMKIPKAGYLAAFIHTKLGWFLSIILPAIILVAFIIKDIIKEALRKESSAIARHKTEMHPRSGEHKSQSEFRLNNAYENDLKFRDRRLKALLKEVVKDY